MNLTNDSAIQIPKVPRPAVAASAATGTGATAAVASAVTCAETWTPPAPPQGDTARLMAGLAKSLASLTAPGAAPSNGPSDSENAAKLGSNDDPLAVVALPSRGCDTLGSNLGGTLVGDLGDGLAELPPLECFASLSPKSSLLVALWAPRPMPPRAHGSASGGSAAKATGALAALLQSGGRAYDGSPRTVVEDVQGPATPSPTPLSCKPALLFFKTPCKPPYKPSAANFLASPEAKCDEPCGAQVEVRSPPCAPAVQHNANHSRAVLLCLGTTPLPPRLCTRASSSSRRTASWSQPWDSSSIIFTVHQQLKIVNLLYGSRRMLSFSVSLFCDIYIRAHFPFARSLYSNKTNQ